MSRFELLLMRHGSTEDSAAGGDAERRLTPAGRDQVAIVGRALAGLGLVPNAVISSPFARARETAEIVVAQTAPDATVVSDPMLFPGGSPRTVIKVLIAFARAQLDRRILAVGHNPSITATLGQLVCGAAAIRFNVATGDVAHLSVDTTADDPRAVVMGFYPSVAFQRLV